VLRVNILRWDVVVGLWRDHTKTSTNWQFIQLV
jgi:hypothetical protein